MDGEKDKCMYDTYIYIDILLHVMNMYFYLDI